MPHESSRDMNRRLFLQRAMATAVIGGGTESMSWLLPSHYTPAEAVRTPDGALQQLLAGNQRFAANQLTSLQQDLNILKAHTVDKQEPFAAVLACADSRVPVELIFDQTIGHVFVTRVAGNVVTPEIIASLEYAVAILGVRALVVLGHSGCGAVKAAMKGENAPGQISALYPALRPAVEFGAGSIAKGIEANARAQAVLLRTSSTVIRDAVTKGKLVVAAGIYDLATGRVALSSS